MKDNSGKSLVALSITIITFLIMGFVLIAMLFLNPSIDERRNEEINELTSGYNQIV